MKISRIAGALLLSLTAAGAQAVPLSTLLGGGSIVANDRLFDSWFLTSYSTSDATRSFNADNIDVTALTDGGDKPGPGLNFSVSNGELTVTGDGIYGFIDLMFGFRVSTLDPLSRIGDNSLAYAGGTAYWSVLVDGSFDVGSYIHESIGTAQGGSDLGTKNIEFSTLDAGNGQVDTRKLSDSAVFPAQNEIWVTKNILVWAVDNTDSAGVFGFEQRFSKAVPEPASFALIGIGLLGLGAMRRRQA